MSFSFTIYTNTGLLIFLGYRMNKNVFGSYVHIVGHVNTNCSTVLDSQFLLLATLHTDVHAHHEYVTKATSVAASGNIMKRLLYSHRS